MPINNNTVIEISKAYGFNLVGFSQADVLDAESEKLEDWLSKGFDAGMEYMSRNIEKRKNVKKILSSAKSVISLGMNYFNPEAHTNENSKGKVSRYAWGKDYHLVIWEKLDKIVNDLKKAESEFESVYSVDTGPVMDKAWAVRGGLGWLGKHTNVINKEIGSWFFIANIITNWKFDYSSPIDDFCGSCTSCIDACPTNAIVNEYLLDSNRCISYLTIENKREIPEEFQGKFENWLFGCDICQEVCPWNIKFSKHTSIEEFNPQGGNTEIDLLQVLNFSQTDFNQRFSDSPIKRAKLKGLKRNAEFLLNGNF